MEKEALKYAEIRVDSQFHQNYSCDPHKFIGDYHYLVEKLTQIAFSSFKEFSINLQSSIYSLLESYISQKKTVYPGLSKISFPLQHYPNLQDLFEKMTYLLFQQVFYYNFIRSFTKHEINTYFPSIVKSLNKEEKTIFDTIERNILEMTECVEFAPVFNIHSDVLSFWKFFDNPRIRIILQKYNSLCELIDFWNLPSFNFTEFIQQLIPIEDQKIYGQIYTPEPIAELMTELVINNSNQSILDPACGCGVFLDKVYTRLLTLKEFDTQKGDNFHEELLSQIWGVELHSYPAHLTMLKLALRDLSVITNEVGVIVEDFLNLGPMEKYLVHTKDLSTNQILTREMPHKFDVILANPPYIKQEKIPHKKQMMQNLPTFASYRQSIIPSPDKSDHTDKIRLNLSAKTDYYGFFLWYSTFFLKPTGILCFLIPDKWMDVKYGENIKQFIKDFYKIKAIIGFKQNLFTSAQVSTVILLAERYDGLKNKKIRDQNIVKFGLVHNDHIDATLIQKIKAPISSEIHAKVKQNSFYFQNTDLNFTCAYIQQETLGISEKWTYKFLYQSHFYLSLLQKELISLDNHEITSVIGGLKTGANAFFYPSQEIITEFGIEPKFLVSGIKSGRNLSKGYIVRDNLNPFLSIPANCNLFKYPGLKKYIRWCEKNKKYHERPSVKWQPWYSIPKTNQDCPEIIFLRHINEDFRALWNKSGCITADGIRGIKIYQPTHLLFYLGVCNSSFFYWQAHVEGRWEGQGDLQLLVYELKKFKIPDIRKLNKAEIHAVNEAFIQLVCSQENDHRVPTWIHYLLEDIPQFLMKQYTKLDQAKKPHSFQKKLDLAVLQTLGLENQYELLISELQWLEQKRITKKIP